MNLLALCLTLNKRELTHKNKIKWLAPESQALSDCTDTLNFSLDFSTGFFSTAFYSLLSTARVVKGIMLLQLGFSYFKDQQQQNSTTVVGRTIFILFFF